MTVVKYNSAQALRDSGKSVTQAQGDVLDKLDQQIWVEDVVKDKLAEPRDKIDWYEVAETITCYVLIGFIGWVIISYFV